MAVMPNNTPITEHDDYSYVGETPPHGACPPGDYYADASGGEFSSVVALRRCGIGICMLKSTYNIDAQDPDQPLLWGVFAPLVTLVGIRHTVVRAELYAILLIVRNVVIGSFVSVATDSKANTDLYLAGYDACMLSSNPDLWEELFSLI